MAKDTRSIEEVIREALEARFGLRNVRELECDPEGDSRLVLEVDDHTHKTTFRVVIDEA